LKNNYLPILTLRITLRERKRFFGNGGLKAILNLKRTTLKKGKRHFNLKKCKTGDA
jgi:hypothetical protein